MTAVWILSVELIDGVVDVLKHIGDLLIVLMVCGQVLQAGSLLMAISFTQCCLITFKMHHSISIHPLSFVLWQKFNFFLYIRVVLNWRVTD